VLEHVDPVLSRAHRELYPERMAEHIPFSLTLHYPWVPAAEVTDADLERLQRFFAGRSRLELELTHVSEFPGVVAYAVPEPDEELRATMRALWAMYPQLPPYGQPGSDPPPHATLGRYEGPDADHVRAGEGTRGAPPPRALCDHGSDPSRGVRTGSVAHPRDVSFRGRLALYVARILASGRARGMPLRECSCQRSGSEARIAAAPADLRVRFVGRRRPGPL
jgi:2'-5' RNA ligase superfamily